MLHLNFEKFFSEVCNNLGNDNTIGVKSAASKVLVAAKYSSTKKQ